MEASLRQLGEATAQAQQAMTSYLLNEEDGWPDAHVFVALKAQQAALEAVKQLISRTPAQGR